MTTDRLVFGTASLHRLYPHSQASRLLSRAYELGIREFDTSPYYGYGLSEAVIGQALERYADIKINTKVGIYPSIKPIRNPTYSKTLTYKFINKILRREDRLIDTNLKLATISLERSLERLAKNNINILFFHDMTYSPEIAEQLIKWSRTERDVKSYGVTGKLVELKKFMDQPDFSDWHFQTNIQDLQENKNETYMRRITRTYGHFSSDLPNDWRKEILKYPKRKIVFFTRNEKRLLQMSKNGC
jgi:aryl-alcohol dehydrogenase-like predicted oxidoreductase